MTEPSLFEKLNNHNLEKLVLQCDFKIFLDKLDKNSVDLFLTDPPYSISRDTGFSNVKKGVKRFSVSMDFGKWDHKQIDLDTLCKGAYRVLRQGGTVIIWYDLWKISFLQEAMKRAGFKMIRLIIWQKTNPVPLNQRATYLSNSREIAILGVKGGKPVFNDKYHNGVYEFPIPREKRIHSTQKPLNLFKALIETHSRKGDLVIDSFVGSGTTAFAALETSRKFLVCDIDADYVEAARNRLKSKFDTVYFQSSKKHI